LLEEQAHARVQCLARASVKQFRSLHREETAQMQVPISDPCEKTGLSAMFIMAKDQINEECLLRKGES